MKQGACMTQCSQSVRSMVAHRAIARAFLYMFFLSLFFWWEIFMNVWHQTHGDRVNLKTPPRVRAWMIYARVIPHLLKQGVNVFVLLCQSSLSRWRWRYSSVGTELVLERGSGESQRGNLLSVVFCRQRWFSLLAVRCLGAFEGRKKMQLQETIAFLLIHKSQEATTQHLGRCVYCHIESR